MKFSIILPVYNGGGYVKECVKSILSQSVTDFNLHVLDSSSTDGSLEWIRSLNDPRIVFYPAEKKLTIEENWNRITGIPKNEFMTVIGHDDLFHPDYLQKMDELIGKHPKATLYQAHYNYINMSFPYLLTITATFSSLAIRSLIKLTYSPNACW